MNLLRAIATVSGFTLLSRVLGFVRDILIAALLGTGGVADAFFVAFKFPNLFRRLFAEGAFAAAFVPMLAGELERGGRSAAETFISRTLSALLLVLIVFVAVMQLIMPVALLVFAPGFAQDPEKFDLAVWLSRLTFPYLVFISAVALIAGVLNTLNRFAAAAAAPVLLNLCLIGAVLFLTPHLASGAHALAWGVFGAGVIQLLWMVHNCRRAGIALSLCWPGPDDKLKTLLKRMAPGLFGAGVYQLNLVIDTILASLVSDGAVSFLYYADRINQLPLGVIGTAIGTALLPTLSRAVQGGDAVAAQHSQNRGLEIGLLLTLPAAAALAILAEPIVTVLFERGAFDGDSTRQTAAALAVFALGLPAYVLVKILVPGFFAREDTATPVKIATAALIANIVLNLALMPLLGHVGIALATALSAWLNAGALAVGLHRRNCLKPDARLKNRFVKIIVATGLMAGALLVAMTAIWGDLGARTAQTGFLTASVFAGMALFVLACQITGAARIGEVRALLSRNTS